MNLHLVDVNPEVVRAWREVFSPRDQVTISQGNIVAVALNALVSPANAWGFMDEGVDRYYRDFFGGQVEKNVFHLIASLPHGHLPVGDSLVVETGHERVPFLIVAPTMVEPESIGAEACYQATKAALKAAERYRDVITDVYFPGMATGAGHVPPEEAALAMAQAWREIHGHGNGNRSGYE